MSLVPMSALHREYKFPRFCHSAITGAAQDEHLMVQSLLQEKDQFRQPTWNLVFSFEETPLVIILLSCASSFRSRYATLGTEAKSSNSFSKRWATGPKTFRRVFLSAGECLFWFFSLMAILVLEKPYLHIMPHGSMFEKRWEFDA